MAQTYNTLDAAVCRRVEVLSSEQLDPAERLLHANEAQRSLARRFPFSWLLKTASLTIAAGDESVALPSDFSQLGLLYYVSDGKTIFVDGSLALSDFRSKYPPGTIDDDEPLHYVLFGENILFQPGWAAGGTLYIDYIAYPPDLDTGTNDENVITRKAYDWLLFRMCEKALEHNFEEEKAMNLWRAKAEAEELKLIAEDQRATAGMRPIVVRRPGGI